MLKEFENEKNSGDELDEWLSVAEKKKNNITNSEENNDKNENKNKGNKKVSFKENNEEIANELKLLHGSDMMSSAGSIEFDASDGLYVCFFSHLFFCCDAW